MFFVLAGGWRFRFGAVRTWIRRSAMYLVQLTNTVLRIFLCLQDLERMIMPIQKSLSRSLRRRASPKCIRPMSLRSGTLTNPVHPMIFSWRERPEVEPCCALSHQRTQQRSELQLYPKYWKGMGRDRSGRCRYPQWSLQPRQFRSTARIPAWRTPNTGAITASAGEVWWSLLVSSQSRQLTRWFVSAVAAGIARLRHEHGHLCRSDLLNAGQNRIAPVPTGLD